MHPCYAVWGLELMSMSERECTKPQCHELAVGTLTYSYADATAVFGPLAETRVPQSFDLCQRHVDALVLPHGWQLIRHVSYDGVQSPQ